MNYYSYYTAGTHSALAAFAGFTRSIQMHKNIIIAAETGSDITPELAGELGVYLIPMHVQMDDRTLDDGTFPVNDICDFYERTGRVPKTSGSTPFDCRRVFDAIHAEHPDKYILYLAYSAITTVSYQSAVIAAEGDELFRIIDTKQVSVGQGLAVRETAAYLSAHPDCSIDEAAAAAESIASRVEMSFIPDNLDYLRAGGRVSNTTALVGNLLNLHPCIEIIDGKLMAKKKYRGSTDSIIPKMLRDFTEKHRPVRDKLILIHSIGLPTSSMRIAEEAAAALGYTGVEWCRTGCVITCHGGPKAFGIVGIRD